MTRNLLPEEDALDDPDDDDEADPTLPGDLWFISQSRALRRWTSAGEPEGPSYTLGRLCRRRLETPCSDHQFAYR
jgi:hypothetical protein